MCKVRIVNTLVTICAIVLAGITFFLKIIQYELFQWEACVIASHSDSFHFHTLSVV